MRRLGKDERGSSLVMTIIAMTFISLLAVAVISMTVTNIRLKQAQKGSQTNFYDADSIVDAVRAGVENLSDNSARDAYETVFASYGAIRSGSSDSLTDKYAKQYMNAMIISLSGGECDISMAGSTLYYKDEVIRGFLTEAQAKYSGGNFVDGYKSNPGGKGVMEYDSKIQSLVIKDITVVKTEGDYQTQINTDIRVNLPEMKSDTNSAYLNYALIADNKVKITGAASSATINGSIYSGTVLRDTETDEPEAGFMIDSGATLNVNADAVISRGDILLRAGSNMAINGLDSVASVWVENVETKPSSGGASGNVLSINGEMKISDDLELWGDNDSVTLTGEYNGYNYNKDYSAANIYSISDNANFNSAMLINGKNCTLDLSGLSSLILSGKTFISKKANDGESLSGAGSLYAGSRDIRTGESLTVKSSQLAYYVPKDFWKLIGSSGTTFSSPVVFTPIEGSTEQYEFDSEGYNKYVNVLGFNVMDYVDPVEPLAYYYRNDTSVKDEDLTYFYLNLRDDKLKDFYNIYSSASPQYSTLKDVNKKYMSNIGIRLDDNAAILTAGNILSKDTATGQEKFTLGHSSPDAGSNLYNSKIVATTKEYMSLQMSLVSDYSKAFTSSQYRLSDSELDEYTKAGITGTATERTNLFDVLVDRSAVVDYENKSSIDSNLPASSIVVVKNGDYIWNGSETGGIIIATGEVELRKNFKGLILSGKDIRFAGATQVDADGERVEEILAADQTVYNMLSKYFRKTMASTIARGDDSENDEGVFYENWKKN